MSETAASSSPPPEPPIAPPTAPGVIVLSRPPSSWPTILGVIAIVFGCLGMLQGVLTLFTRMTMDFASGIAGDQPQFAVVRKWMPWTIGMGVAGGVIAAILLFAGIQLIRRKPASAGLIRGWAIIKIIYALPATGVGLIMQLEQAAAVSQQAGVAGAFAPGSLSIIGVGSSIVGGLWLLAFPVFVLFWFRRDAVREEIGRWARPAPRA